MNDKERMSFFADRFGRDGAFSLCFAYALPKLRQVAMNLGYNLAIHGSMLRDLDILAVPWYDEVASATELIEAIRATVGGFVPETTDIGRNPVTRPHGRLGCAIHLVKGQLPFIDLSIVPTRPDEWRTSVIAECDTKIAIIQKRLDKAQEELQQANELLTAALRKEKGK